MLRLKVAEMSESNAIKRLMNRSIRELQADYLTPEQVEASSAGMGLDTQLIEDQTYFTVWDGEELVGCGAGPIGQLCMAAIIRPTVMTVFLIPKLNGPEYAPCIPIRIIQSAALDV